MTVFVEPGFDDSLIGNRISSTEIGQKTVFINQTLKMKHTTIWDCCSDDTIHFLQTYQTNQGEIQ